MDKPFVFCHMLMSLDGKIIGNFMQTEESKKSGETFFNLAFTEDGYYQHQGWLSGRATTDDNFTHYKKPDLDIGVEEIPEGDYLFQTDLDKYYISVDPSGKLGWQENFIDYQGVKAQVLEVLTDQATIQYRAYLRKLNIPYIIAGTSELDFNLVVQKLKQNFNIETMMLGGGGKLNWSFIQAGLCDEVSIVIAPAADGSSQSPAIFDTKEHLSDDSAVAFELAQAEVLDGQTVWLRYKVKNK
nr:RibD family protein [Mammaliicoccus sp. Marseille-Q6498]